MQEMCLLAAGFQERIDIVLTRTMADAVLVADRMSAIAPLVTFSLP